MNSVLIFSPSSMDWLTISIPEGHTMDWSSSECMYYGTLFALASQNGFDRKRAVILAEAGVSKRLYPGIIFDSGIEDDLELLSGN
jgi:hypothetical protein